MLLLEDSSTFHNFQALHLAVVASFPCNIWGKKTLQPSISILPYTQSLQKPRDCHGQISGSSEFADQESQKKMKLIKSSQHKPIQILLNRGSKIQENFLTFAETHSYVVYGWASVLSYGQHSLSSAGESDCNYQSNKYEFPSQIIFHFSWQWSHPSQNQLHIALETTGYLMLLGCTICLILSPFPQPYCPLSVLLIHLDIAILYPVLGSS